MYQVLLFHIVFSLAIAAVVAAVVAVILGQVSMVQRSSLEIAVHEVFNIFQVPMYKFR